MVTSSAKEILAGITQTRPRLNTVRPFAKNKKSRRVEIENSLPENQRAAAYKLYYGLSLAQYLIPMHKVDMQIQTRIKTKPDQTGMSKSRSLDSTPVALGGEPVGFYSISGINIFICRYCSRVWYLD